MKDLKVYDGAGWQSLKGPPGPSTPSADADNTITKGSDGLLYSGREVSFQATPPPLPEMENVATPLPLLWVSSGMVYVAVPERPAEFGALPPEWLAVNRPSADDGNLITLGSDGLPMVRGDLVANGVWTPMMNGSVVGAGYWSRSGPIVTVIIEWGEVSDIEDGALVEGLPCSLALSDDLSYYPSYTAVSTFETVRLGAGDLFFTGDPTVLVLQLVSPDSNYITLASTSTMTYRTQDAFLV
jgi:hypothetical protein